MRAIAASVLVLVISLAAASPLVVGADDTTKDAVDAKAPKSKIPVNKETTHVLGPIDKDGYVDFEAALNERLGKAVAPEKNANALLWKVLGPRPEGGNGMPEEFFKWLGIKEPPVDGEYWISINRYLENHAKIEPGDEATREVYDQQSRCGQRPWTAKECPHIAAWLRLNEKHLATVIEASKLPNYYNPLVSTKSPKGSSGLISALLPGVQKCRELAAALSARAMLRVSEGKVEEAWQDLLACHRLGRLIARGGGTLIESLVGIALDAVASNAELAFLDRAKLTPKQIRDCMRDLQALPPMPPAADKIDVGERFMMLDSILLIRRGDGDGLGLAGFPKKDDPAAQQALDAIDWGLIMRNGNKWYDRLAGAMRIKDRAEREKELDQIENDLQALAKKNKNMANV